MTGCIQLPTVRWLFVPLLFFLPFTAIAIRLFGFRRMYGFAGCLAGFISKWANPPAEPLHKAQQISRTVTLSNRCLSFYQATCLAESLLLWGILRGNGIDARFYLGVRTITGPLDAHAWVEYNNSILNDIESVKTVYETFDLGDLTPGENTE